MKTFIASCMLLATFSASANDMQAYATATRECFNEVGTQISIQFSQAAHAARPGSAREARALQRLERLNDYLLFYVVTETACHEGAPNGQELKCIIDNYATGTISLAKKYKAVDVVNSVPSCRYLKTH